VNNLFKVLKYKMWRTLRKLRLEVYPLDRRNSVQSYLSYLFVTKGVDCVWDIGANTGQYASMLRNIGFKGEIISFEPIPEAWEELNRHSASDNKWIVHHRCAVGLNEGFASMNVTADSVSSSLLRPNDINSVVNIVEVKVERLDSIIKQIGLNSCSLLKLDCQGSEYEILLSASNQISNFEYVQLEASIYALYEGEKTFHDLVGLMDSCGFDVAVIFPGITDFLDRMVQVELIFKRR
jgi:FkbM family methyltransferase